MSYAYSGGRVAVASREIFRPAEWSYNYNASGRLVETTREIFLPLRERYVWAGDRIAEIQSEDLAGSFVSTVRYGYDSLRRLSLETKTSADDPYVRTYAYDSRGRLVRSSQTLFQPHEMTYEWDEADRLVRVRRTQLQPFEQTFHYCN